MTVTRAGVALVMPRSFIVSTHRTRGRVSQTNRMGGGSYPASGLRPVQAGADTAVPAPAVPAPGPGRGLGCEGQAWGLCTCSPAGPGTGRAGRRQRGRKERGQEGRGCGRPEGRAEGQTQAEAWRGADGSVACLVSCAPGAGTAGTLPAGETLPSRASRSRRQRTPPGARPAPASPTVRGPQPARPAPHARDGAPRPRSVQGHAPDSGAHPTARSLTCPVQRLRCGRRLPAPSRTPRCGPPRSPRGGDVWTLLSPCGPWSVT